MDARTVAFLLGASLVLLSLAGLAAALVEGGLEVGLGALEVFALVFALGALVLLLTWAFGRRDGG